MQEIRKIVLTGGPCAGKTTAMSWVENAFTEKGYKVLFVPERIYGKRLQGPFCTGDGNGTDFRRCCSMDLRQQRAISDDPDAAAEIQRGYV